MQRPFAFCHCKLYRSSTCATTASIQLCTCQRPSQVPASRLHECLLCAQGCACAAARRAGAARAQACRAACSAHPCSRRCRAGHRHRRAWRLRASRRAAGCGRCPGCCGARGRLALLSCALAGELCSVPCNPLELVAYAYPSYCIALAPCLLAKHAASGGLCMSAWWCTRSVHLQAYSQT